VTQALAMEVIRSLRKRRMTSANALLQSVTAYAVGARKL
jgi:hypothetical protein